MCSKTCCPITTFLTLLLLSLSLLLFLLLSPPYITTYISSQISHSRILNNNTNPLFSTWSENTSPGSIPQYYDFYLFNVTNPDEIIQGNVPLLRQIGPFRYRDYHEEIGIHWVEDYEFIRCVGYEYFVFQEDAFCVEGQGCFEMSGMTPEDRFVTVNIPYAAVLNQVSPEHDWYAALVVDLLMSGSNSSVFMEIKIGELLWGGHEYSLLKLLNDTIQPGIPTEFALQVNMTSKEDAMAKNNYKYDEYNTGVKNISEIGMYTKWKGEAVQDIWGNHEANVVSGTDGTGFRPGNLNGDPVLSFVPGAFRKIALVKDGENVVEGITLYKYRMDNTTLLNSSINPQYYLNAPSGLLNITKAMNGAPVFISKPLFLDADSYYRNSVIFLDKELDRDLYDTHLDVEPYSGVVMNAHRRIQINIQVKGTVLLYPRLKEIFFPIAWFDQHATISPEKAKEFKDQVYFINDLVHYGTLIGYGLSGVLGLLSFVCLCCGVRKRYLKRKGYYAVPDDMIN